MTKLTVAALQLAFTENATDNIMAVAKLVREASAKGAEVVLPPSFSKGPTSAESRTRRNSRTPVRLASTRRSWRCRSLRKS